MNDTHITVVVNGSEALTVPLVGLLDPLESGNLTDEHAAAMLAPASHVHTTNLSQLEGPIAGPGRRLLLQGELRLSCLSAGAVTLIMHQMPLVRNCISPIPGLLELEPSGAQISKLSLVCFCLQSPTSH